MRDHLATSGVIGPAKFVHEGVNETLKTDLVTRRCADSATVIERFLKQQADPYRKALGGEILQHDLEDRAA